MKINLGEAPDALLSTNEVAALLNVSVATVVRWRSERVNLPFTRIGLRGSPRYRVVDVEDYLEQNAVHVVVAYDIGDGRPRRTRRKLRGSLA